jgi:hypothetical protein
MLEGTFARLHCDEFAELRKDLVTRNALIEAFWIHARNVVEFITHPKGDGVSGTVSAKDFTKNFYPSMGMKTLDQKIKVQVSHLTYDRKSDADQKLHEHEMLRAKQAIDKEIERFEGSNLVVSLLKSPRRLEVESLSFGTVSIIYVVGVRYLLRDWGERIRTATWRFVHLTEIPAELAANVVGPFSGS